MLIGVLLAGLPGGHAGEHQHGVQARLDAGDDIRVHPVPHHHGVLGVDAQHPQAGPHHQGIGLAHEIGALSRGQLDGGDEGPAGRDDASLRRGGQVRVCANELRPGVHQADGLGNLLQVVGGGFSHHHIVRVHVVIGDAFIVQGVGNPVLAHHVGAASRGLAVQEVGRGQGTGVKVGLVHVQPHPGQLLLELLGGVLAGVREEQEVFLFLRQPVNEFLHAGQNLVSMIDHAVHVADKALLFSQLIHGPLLLHQGRGALCNLVFPFFQVSHIPSGLSKKFGESFSRA